MDSRFFEQVWQRHAGLKDLPQIADAVARELAKQPSFCLWLDAEMGCGKTTFTRFLMQQLGLDPRIPVASPTYTYMNEYQLESGLYAHLDMYRAGAGMYWDELGCADWRDFKGIVIEWPEKLVESSFTKPTHRLQITANQLDQREYAFFTRFT